MALPRAARTIPVTDPAVPQELFRRILVALDVSQDSLAALEAAADMAASLEADLVGLFIEDIDLLNTAALPFTRQVGTISREPMPLETADVERAFKAQAAALRRRLAQFERDRRLHWELRIERDRRAAALAKSTQPGDLVALADPQRSVDLTMFSCSVLLLGQARRDSAPIAVIADGSEAGRPALATAAMLAARQRVPLLVLVLAESGAQAAERERQTAALLPSGLAASFRQIAPPSAAAVIGALRANRAQLCVCGGAPVAAALGLSLADLARGGGCSVLDCRP
jgi:hypothetical protein